MVNAFSYDVIPELRTKYNLNTLDMVFIDHEKSSYVTDLQKIEDSGILHKGSVVFADNVLTSSPEFSKYIRSSNRYECQYYEICYQYSGNRYPDRMDRGIFKGANI